jgi:hypothetical protein
MTINRISVRGMVLLCVVISTLAAAMPALAKIGAPVATFNAKMSRLFLLKETTPKDGNTYFRYVLIGDQDRQKRSPGFGAGITLTGKANKIAGQSLVVRLGQNRQVGKMFAVMLSMNVCYEALGKESPKTPQATNAEVQAYASAVERALSGAPEYIRYNGFPMKITMSKTKDSDLLVAITAVPSDTASK